MTIAVKFYAQLRDEFKCDEMSVEVDEGHTVADLVGELMADKQRISGLPIRFAVNDAFVRGEHKLRSGDRLVLMPPVSGG